MRKLSMFVLTTLDGYFEGENHDISWHNVDNEFNEFAVQQLNQTDVLLFGRRTYSLMESFWPTAQPSDPNDLLVAEKLNFLPKIVFSKTMEQVAEKEKWKNITLIKDNIPEEIQKLKEAAGKDLLILASSNLCVSLLEQQLLDEIRILLNPVVLGKGTPLFQGIQHKINMNLFNTCKFRNGNMLLYYSVH